jgi:hypothetical protein
MKLALAAVIAGTTALSGLGAIPTLAAPSDATALPVRLQLKSLRIDDSQEDGAGENGDEPYLFLALVFADGSTLRADGLSQGTARVRVSRLSLPAQGSSSTATVPIPELGTKAISTLLPIAGAPLATGQQAASVSLAVIAMERDQRNSASADLLRLSLAEALTARVNAAIRRLGPTDLPNLPSAVQGAIASTLTTKVLTGPSGLLAPVLNGPDGDDLIGTGIAQWTYPEILAAGKAGRLFSLPFGAAGVRWTLSGLMQVRE